jgi:hypothetical protein
MDRHAEFLRVVTQQVEQHLVVRGGRKIAWRLLPR